MSIWQMNQTATKKGQTVSPKAENVGVFRNQNRIEVFELEQSALNALALIQTGVTLQALVQAELDHYLPEFIQKGWIVQLY